MIWANRCHKSSDLHKSLYFYMFLTVSNDFAFIMLKSELLPSLFADI